MDVSLVIATFNRAELLSDALKSVAASKVLEPDKVEVVIIDNNSTDDTAETVKEVRARGFPFALHYFLERERGLSAARNRGIAESSGTFVAFMDDDQRIEQNYLARVTGVFSSTGAGVIGGPVTYYNAEDIPPWATRLIAEFGQFYAGDEVRALTPDERLLGGGNMVIDRRVLQQVGGFNHSLGRNGANLFANEDQEIQQRVHDAGHTIFYSPALHQYHYLRPERLTRRYWRRNRFDWGRTTYRHSRLRAPRSDSKELFGVPRWLWILLVSREIPRYFGSLINVSAEQRFERQLDIFVMLGHICEAHAMRHTD